jgi:hypothetical protein
MRRLLIAATALAMLGGVAHAQNAGSNSSSTATNTSGSQSTSVSNPTVNVIGNPIGNGASSSTSGAKSSSGSRSNSRSTAVGNVTNVYTGSGGYGSGVTGGGSTAAGDPATTTAATTTAGTGTAGDPTTNLNYSGSYTVRNTPEVIPPNVMGGNPCAVGASGGISAPGFGLAMGATWADRACERRQQAALLFNMGEQKVALELMCQDDNVRAAMKIAARPCANRTGCPGGGACRSQANGGCCATRGAKTRVVCTREARYRGVQGLCRSVVRQVTSRRTRRPLRLVGPYAGMHCRRMLSAVPHSRPFRREIFRDGAHRSHPATCSCGTHAARRGVRAWLGAGV